MGEIFYSNLTEEEGVSQKVKWRLDKREVIHLKGAGVLM